MDTTMIDTENESYNILRQICEAFSNEDARLHYEVGRYYLDLYFPVYRLAVEFDEDHHTIDFYSKPDKHREQDIVEQLDCTFIRITDKMSIFTVINKIHCHMKARR